MTQGSEVPMLAANMSSDVCSNSLTAPPLVLLRPPGSRATTRSTQEQQSHSVRLKLTVHPAEKIVLAAPARCHARKKRAVRETLTSCLFPSKW